MRINTATRNLSRDVCKKANHAVMGESGFSRSEPNPSIHTWRRVVVIEIVLRQSEKAKK